MSLPIASIQVDISKDNHDAEIKDLFAEIGREIKSYVKGKMQDPSEENDEIRVKYADKLEQIIV